MSAGKPETGERRRAGQLNLLPLLLVAQMMLLTSITVSHGGAFNESAHHSNMLEMFDRTCHPQWTVIHSSSINEETYGCSSETEIRAHVYHGVDEGWTMYGWGLDGGEYATKEAAKQKAERQSAYWLRPKGPWWKPWKEFEGQAMSSSAASRRP